MIHSDDYFLSADNPLATVDQRTVEDLALEIVRHPDMLRARERAAHFWKAVAEYPAGGQMSRFASTGLIG